MNKKKQLLKMFIPICVVVIAIIISLVFVFNHTNTKEYDNKLNEAQKYVEELNYEKAEIAYLEAIKIDSKQSKAYLKLADIYIKNNQKDSAIKILKQAEKNISDDDKSVIQKKKQEVSKYVTYTWIVEPTIEADDIYYLSNRNGGIQNNNGLQMMNRYAVLQKNNLYYLIGIDGKQLPFSCEKIWTGQEGYIVDFTEEQIDKYGHRNKEKALITSSGTIVFGDEGSDPLWELVLYDNELTLVFNTVDAGMELDEIDESYIENKEYPIPIQKVNNIHGIQNNSETFVKWRRSQKGKYAIYDEDGLKTKFIYDEIGSYKDGLMAVKKGDKWGYVDKTGKVIIPIKYDASWNYHNNYPYWYDVDYKDYCYSASDNYVVLKDGSKWLMSDTEGNVVIPEGIFEKILPVYNNQCWVKQDGKWGVISLDSKTVQSKEEIISALEGKWVDIIDESDENYDTWFNGTTTFKKDGTIIRNMQRCTEKGKYTISNDGTVVAKMTSQDYSGPITDDNSTGHSKTDNFTLEITYTFVDENTLSIKYSDIDKTDQKSLEIYKKK